MEGPQCISGSVIMDLLLARSKPTSSVEKMRSKYHSGIWPRTYIFYPITDLPWLPPGPLGTPNHHVSSFLS